MDQPRSTPRSTRTRRRGWTPARQDRFERLISRYRFDPTHHGDLDVVDIGVGHGETTLASALNEPGQHHVAVELHVPGVARLLDALDTYQLDNVRVFVGDILELVPMLEPGQVGELRVICPDPWPKARHHRRRLIRPDTMGLFARSLRDDGALHIATDHDDYLIWIERTVTSSGHFTGGEAPRPSWRVDTRYTRRAAVAGRTVNDLRYELAGTSPRA